MAQVKNKKENSELNKAKNTVTSKKTTSKKEENKIEKDDVLVEKKSTTKTKRVNKTPEKSEVKKSSTKTPSNIPSKTTKKVPEKTGNTMSEKKSTTKSKSSNTSNKNAKNKANATGSKSTKSMEKSSKTKVTENKPKTRDMEVDLEEDTVIVENEETNLEKIEDIKIVEKEIEKDIKSKKKLPKEEEEKLNSVVFENLCVGIAFMVYLFFILLGFINIRNNVYIVDLKMFSFILVIIAIVLFERAYKKDSGKLCAFGIETLVLATITMALLYITLQIPQKFLAISLIISLLSSIYYVAKSIYLYVKMKKRYFVENIKDIMQKEDN